MSASDVQRSERILDKIGGRLGLTEPGKQWLLCATDPFHDTPLNVCGYPDVEEAASVVQVVRVSTNIKVPTGITGNWDLHIHSWPTLLSSPFYYGLTQDGAVTTNFVNYGSFQVAVKTTSSATWGGLQYCAVASGNATYDSGASSTAIPANDITLQLEPYLRGTFRIIGMGYEAINTTSDLNVQGLVTCYRMPAPDPDSASAVAMSYNGLTLSPSEAWLGYGSVVFDQQPPLNSGTALLLDGSKQWKAKEGAYIVSTFNSEQIPAGPVVNCRSYSLNTQDSQYSAGTIQNVISGFTPVFNILIPPTSSTNLIVPYKPAGLLDTRFNASGIYFTGLSNSTTITLNAIYYIEKFPSQNDTDLVVLAKHSCRSDTIARELYSEIIREMPVGVPQRMNGMGEWFADAVSSAADFISPVLSAIPTPMTQGLGGVLKTAGNVAKSLGSKKEAQAPYSATGANTLVAVPKKKVVMPVAKAVKKTKKKKTK